MHLVQLIGLLPSFCISALRDSLFQGFGVSQLCRGVHRLDINGLAYSSLFEHTQVHCGQEL